MTLPEIVLRISESRISGDKIDYIVIGPENLGEFFRESLRVGSLVHCNTNIHDFSICGIPVERGSVTEIMYKDNPFKGEV